MTITGSSILQRDPGATAVIAPYGPRGPVIMGTSATSANIELGDVVFAMNEYGLGFAPGIRLRATVVGAANQWIEGVATSYDGNLLGIKIDLFEGDGIYSNWQITVAGEPGVQGPIGPIGATGPVTEAPQDSRKYLRFNATWQPQDPDLVSLAAATATNAIFYRSGPDTWAPVTIGSGIGFSGGVISAASGGGNVSNFGTPVAGQIARWKNNQQIEGFDASTVYAPYAALVPNHGRLSFVDATHLSFLPYNGDRIKINGLTYQIPSTGNGIVGLTTIGVFVNGTPGTNLVANQVYNVYAFINGGVITGEFSTSTHSRSSTPGNEGVETKSGDNTRTLIGKIATNASGQFQDVSNARYVFSWFNRRTLSLGGATVPGTGTSATTNVELDASARVFFLSWGDEAVLLQLGGNGNTTGNGFTVGVGIDNVQYGTGGLCQPVSGSGWQIASSSASVTIGEGSHYATPFGGAYINGVAAFFIALIGSIRG